MVVEAHLIPLPAHSGLTYWELWRQEATDGDITKCIDTDRMYAHAAT